MLHQEQPDTTSTPAAETRVSAKELADAVATLQARKEEAARRVEGTIPIGQAVQELGLDATPDEILAEVQAQRVVQGSRPSPASRRPLAAVVGLSLTLLAGAVWFDLQPMPHGDAPAVTNTAPFVEPPPNPPSYVQTLTEVPDEHPVVCTSTELNTLLSNPHPSLTSMLVQDVRSPNFDAKWCLVKHHGQVYLHGYMALMTDEAMRVGGIDLRNARIDDRSGSGLVYEIPTSLKIGTFTITSSSLFGRDELALHITDIHPDGYAHEALAGVDGF